MEISEVIPSGAVQRAYCAKCDQPMELIFRRFDEVVSGVEICIDGLPQLWCYACERIELPDRTRASIARIHADAVGAKQTRFTIVRRKIERDFGFTGVPFDYDPDDYFYYPGLERPWNTGFLTPVFFNRRVLAKYDASPDYLIQFASPTYGTICSDEFSASFGVNKNGLLIMWLGDVAKLPEPEQYYLKSENVPSDHSLGSEFYDGQIECIFTDPSIEQLVFSARSEFLEACFYRFGAKLAHLDTEVLDIASGLVRPVHSGTKQRREISDSLNKVHLESLDNQQLERLISDLGISCEGTGTLKRLQAILESIDDSSDVNEHMNPFYTLYDLRVASSHLKSEAGTKKILKSVTDRLDLPEDSDLMAIYDKLMSSILSSYGLLREIVTTR